MMHGSFSFPWILLLVIGYSSLCCIRVVGRIPPVGEDKDKISRFLSSPTTWKPLDNATKKYQFSCTPADSSKASSESLQFCGASSFSGRFVNPSDSLRKGYALFGQWSCGRWTTSAGAQLQRAVTITLFDDESSILGAQEAIRMCIAENATRLLAPYSSTLTKAVTPIADEVDQILLAPGAAARDVFHSSRTAFGILPDARLYFDRLGRVMRSLSVKRAFIVEEDEEFTREACKPMVERHKSGTLWYGMEVPVHIRVDTNRSSKASRVEQYRKYLSPRVEGNADGDEALFGCLYEDICVELIHFLRENKLDFSSLAFTTCVHETSFREELLSTKAEELGFPGRFIMGTSTGDSKAALSALDPIGSSSNGITRTETSPEELREEHTAQFGKDPTYHTTASFSLLSLVMIGIDRSNATTGTEIMKFFEGIESRSAFGTVRYEDGQNIRSEAVVTLQHVNDRSLQVVSPDFSASDDLVFPKPEWELMVCQVSNKCGSHGTCTAEGTCDCDTGFVGSGCDINLTAILASIGSVFGFAIFSVTAFLAYRSYRREKENEEQEKRLKNGQAMATVAQQSHLRALSFINHRLRNPTHSIAGTIYMLRDSDDYESLSPSYRGKIELLERCIQQIGGTLNEISSALDAGYGILGSMPSAEDDQSSLKDVDTDSESKDTDRQRHSDEGNHTSSSAPAGSTSKPETFMLSELVRDVRYNIDVSSNIHCKALKLHIPTTDTLGAVDMNEKVDLAHCSRIDASNAATIVGLKSSLMQMLSGINMYAIHNVHRSFWRAEAHLAKRYAHLARNYSKINRRIRQRPNCLSCASAATAASDSGESDSVCIKHFPRSPFTRQLAVEIRCDITSDSSWHSKLIANDPRKRKNSHRTESSSAPGGEGAQEGYWLVWEAKIRIERIVSEEDVHSVRSGGDSDAEKGPQLNKKLTRKERKREQRLQNQETSLQQLASEGLASTMPLVWSTDSLDKQVQEMGGEYEMYLPEPNVLAYAMVIQDHLLALKQNTHDPALSEDFPLKGVPSEPIRAMVEKIISSDLSPVSPIGGLRICLPVRLAPQRALFSLDDDDNNEFQEDQSAAIQPLANNADKRFSRGTNSLTASGYSRPVQVGNFGRRSGHLRRSLSSGVTGSTSTTHTSLYFSRSRSYDSLDNCASRAVIPTLQLSFTTDSSAHVRGRASGHSNNGHTPAPTTQDHESITISGTSGTMHVSPTSVCNETPTTTTVQQAAPSQALEEKKEAEKAYNFLVVDDENTNRMILKKMLKRSGPHKVTVARDGTEVLPLLKQTEQVSSGALSDVPTHSTRKMAVVPEGRPNSPGLKPEAFDAILLDIIMHDMNGDVACRQLREHGCTIPIIATTGNVSQKDTDKYHAVGFNAIVHKPFTGRDLGEALKGVDILVNL
eukprot:gb/GECG01001140.1/.p1 GENE.gb/GECG01001140.1/~~gb/GECG01001140.1/.p1  ORF type:complete len:1399 (+),score=182.57 gb/GECG01001140.1/:1-4197(+)